MAKKQPTTGEQVIHLFCEDWRVRTDVLRLIRAARDEITTQEFRRKRILGRGALADLRRGCEPSLDYAGIEELDSGLVVSNRKLVAGEAANTYYPEFRTQIAAQIADLLRGTTITATKLDPATGQVFGRKDFGGGGGISSGEGITNGVTTVTGEFRGLDERLSHLVVSHDNPAFEWTVTPVYQGEPLVSLQVQQSSEPRE